MQRLFLLLLAMKRLSVWIVIGCIFLSGNLYAQETDSSAVVKEFDQIQVKLDSKSKLLTRKKKEKKEAETELSVYLKELRQSEYELKQTRRRLLTYQTSLETSRKSLQKTEAKFEAHKALFEKRLVAIYKQQPLSIIEFALDPDHYSDLETATYFFEKLVDQDAMLMDDLKARREELRTQKQEYQTRVENLGRLKRQLSQQESNLEMQYNRKARLVSDLDSDIKRLDEEAKILKQSSYRLSKLLTDIGKTTKVYYGSGTFLKPAKGWISSHFGYRNHPIFKRRILHTGMDFAAPKGTTIKAADSGIVVVAGEYQRYRGYGKVTVINHGVRESDGKQISTLYAHQSRILVKEGDFVNRGDEIGWVGTTGFSTGPHLHFEVWENGVQVNPKGYF